MKLIRGTIRLLALTLTTALFMSLFLAGKTILAAVPNKRFRWRNWIFRQWALATTQLLNINVTVTNRRPEGPFLLVTNHLSYIDIVMLAAQLDCAFIAKSEVRSWPAIGYLARRMNTVFINRSRKRDVIRAMSEMQRLMESGIGVVLFAEGTSTSGRNVSPFKTALLELAASRNIPVHYASITYATNARETSAETSVCWWGDMTFTDHFFRLLQLSGFEASLTYGPEPIRDNNRRVLANKLWEAVNAQFRPVIVH